MRLNRSLVLETPSRVADGAGGFVQGWSALGVLWAHVQGKRVTVRGAVGPQRPVEGQRFRDGARVFAIGAVTEADVDGRYLLCMVEELA